MNLLSIDVTDAEGHTCIESADNLSPEVIFETLGPNESAEEELRYLFGVFKG